MSKYETEAMFTPTATAVADHGVEVTGAAATEVVTMWGDTVLGVKHFPHTGTFGAQKHISTRGETALASACMLAGGIVAGPAVGKLVEKIYHPQVVPQTRSFTLGEDPKSDVWMTQELLGGQSRATLISADAAGSRIELLQGMQGDITLSDGVQRDIRELSNAERGFDLPVGARARIELGDFTFFISSVPAGKLPAAATDTDWTAITYTGLSFLVHAMFLFVVYFIPPDPRSLSLDMLAEDNRFVRYALIPPQLEQPQENNWVEDAAEEEAGGQGRRHEGEEGAMGREDSKRTDNRFGIKGPSDNPTPRMARSDLVKLATEGGILAALNSNAPTSPFGADTALGNDPESALGALMGEQIGNNFGYNGLGLNGTGRGGGGDGRGTIGLGHLNTIGHGAGGGTGSGYGRGPGNLRSRRTKAPSVSIRGTASIRGSLSREVIRRHIRRNIPAIRFCYERQLSRRPDLQGRVQVQFVIGQNGSVASARVVSSSMGEPSVEQCVARAVQRITFPSPDGGVVIVTYPFMFQSANR